MKRTTAVLLLLAMLLPPKLSLYGYASPAEADTEITTDTAGESSDTSGESVDPPLTDGDTDPGIVDPGTVDPPSPPGAEDPSVPGTTEPPLTEPPTTEPPTTEPPFTEPAPSEEDLLFDALAAVIDAGGQQLEFSTAEQIPDEWISAACTRALERTPRFFYLGGIDVAITPPEEPDEAGNLFVYQIIPTYRFAPGEELDAAKAYVENETAKIIAQIPEDADRLETVLFLHDYLCTHFAYDGTHTVGDLYNLLQSGHGVCQAYVYLYAYLLDQLSIPNDFAISAEMNHIWNLVRLYGMWYHVDLTWDDPSQDQAGRALHTNFLRSDQGITETGHYNWVAPYRCNSHLFEDSFLYDLSGAVLFTRFGAYGISRRMLVMLDFDTLTATPVADLSNLRWAVWGKPDSLWKEQYINLYCDGALIYFNGPDAVWSFDPELEELELLFTYDSQNGYLYSLTGDGHTLTCTVSTAPGAADRTFRFTTPHVFASEGGFFFSTQTCVVCEHSELYLSPRYGDFITACLSYRQSGVALHDLRLLLLIDQEMLEEYPPLDVELILHSADGDRGVTTTVSTRDLGLFLAYERVYAGGRTYAVADGYQMLGLILRNLEDGSYDAITVAVTIEGYEIYRSTVSADALFPAPDEPPVTGEPPAQGESEDGNDPADGSENTDDTDSTDSTATTDPAPPADPTDTPEETVDPATDSEADPSAGNRSDGLQNTAAAP